MKRASIFFLITLVCFGFIPVITILLLSFSANEIPRIPITDWTAAHYYKSSSDLELRNALLNSIALSTLVAFSATLICLSSIELKFHKLGKLDKVSGLLVCVPFLIPPQILALALLIFYEKLNIPQGSISLLLGHLTLALPLNFFILSLGYLKTPNHYREIAANLGASRTDIFVGVIFPAIKPFVFSALGLSFLISWDEPILSWMLGGYHKTLPTLISGKLGGLWDAKLLVYVIISTTGTLMLFFLTLAALVKKLRTNE